MAWRAAVAAAGSASAASDHLDVDVNVDGLRRWIATVVALVLALLLPASSTAENRVIVRGNYYREASTRVLQPTVDVQVDVPDERLSLGAVYMLDAISSASIASGAAEVTGGDAVFTEIRHETTGYAASRLGEWSLGGFFRYSTETDYISRSLGVSAARDLFSRSVNLSLSYAYNFDRVYRIVNNLGSRQPWCSGNVDVADCRGDGYGKGSNLLQTHYVAAGYSHALHRQLLSLLTLEVAHARGPQDNPYRGAQILGADAETHPLTRTRVALMGELRIAVPKARMALEPNYRFTRDTWDINTHAFDARVHFRVLRHLRLRLRYRYYTQSDAFFWRDAGDYLTPSAECVRDRPEDCATADPKLGRWHSHTPGVQIVYELDGLAKFRGLGWLERGWIEATYNHVFQTNRFGWARVGALTFALAF
jgi:hypothetical protein